MNLRLSLLSLTVGSCSLSALATAQQLTPDHYLVGTQGWLNCKQANVLNTIQLVSPYSGKATVLRVTGLPAGEAPASFVIRTPQSFLVGTKTLNVAVPAAGNIYKVQLQ